MDPNKVDQFNCIGLLITTAILVVAAIITLVAQVWMAIT